MSAVQSAFPILSTADLPQALGFYVELLGGKIGYRFPDSGEPVYVGVDLGESHIGIGSDPGLGDSAPSKHFSLWIYVADCDQMVDLLRDAGVTVLEEPADQPWGERIARVADPDGHVLVVGAKIA